MRAIHLVYHPPHGIFRVADRTSPVQRHQMTTAAPAEPLTIAATDGYPLAATLFGGAEPPRQVVLVSPATGVKRRLYGAFAAYLASRGAAVATWDWRGTGDSRPARMRGFRATMTDWARLDLAGVIGWAAERFPDARISAVGHSFGGQGIGLAPNAGRLHAIATVAAQSGWWGHWPRGQRWKYALLWNVVMPPVTHALGYFPFRRLRVGEDLPKGVALEWARWCRTPDYLGDWSGHAAIRAPLLALVARYGSERKEHRHVSPGEIGVRSIGHFGFFREGVGSRLWPDVADWLDAA